MIKNMEICKCIGSIDCPRKFILKRQAGVIRIQLHFGSFFLEKVSCNLVEIKCEAGCKSS